MSRWSRRGEEQPPDPDVPEEPTWNPRRGARAEPPEPAAEEGDASQWASGRPRRTPLERALSRRAPSGPAVPEPRAPDPEPPSEPEAAPAGRPARVERGSRELPTSTAWRVEEELRAEAQQHEAESERLATEAEAARAEAERREAERAQLAEGDRAERDRLAAEATRARRDAERHERERARLSEEARLARQEAARLEAERKREVAELQQRLERAERALPPSLRAEPPALRDRAVLWSSTAVRLIVAVAIFVVFVTAPLLMIVRSSCPVRGVDRDRWSFVPPGGDKPKGCHDHRNGLQVLFGKG